jgi:hypothetical protein
MAIEGEKSSKLGVATRTAPTPPNALIDHWPSACNRLDSLALSPQQRMLI